MLARVLSRLPALLMTLGILFSHSPATYGADWPYTFRAGDTLWDVCKQYTSSPTCWQELGPLNQIDADRRIPPGTRIRIPADWLKVPPATADLAFVRGEVTLILPGETGQPAQQGTKLPIGAKLNTGEGSATILFADGSSITLAPQSELVLDTLSNFERNGMVDSTVRLNRGVIKTRVIKREPRSQFQTITPSAVASVRGTEYRVNITPPMSDGSEQKEATLVEVYEGLVEVGAEQKNVPVPAEFGTVTKRGEAPSPPVKLLPAPVFLPLAAVHYLHVDDQQRPVDTVPVSWQPVTDAQAYQLNVFTRPSQQGAAEEWIQDKRTANTTTELGGLPLGCYVLQLRAIDQLGLHGVGNRQDICLEKQLPPPQLITPDIASPADEAVTLSWSPVTGATRYEVEIAEHADFSSSLAHQHTSDTQIALAPDTAVWVRVFAVNGNGQRSASSATFSWQPPPPEETDWTFLIPIGLYLIGLVLI